MSTIPTLGHQYKKTGPTAGYLEAQPLRTWNVAPILAHRGLEDVEDGRSQTLKDSEVLFKSYTVPNEQFRA